jgi:hypothetical protein
MFRIFSFLFLTTLVKAQLPETDIWLFKIKKEKDVLSIAEGENITARKGYDNQPYFTPDNKSILYISIREEKQSDVYSYDIAKKYAVQFTRSKESEYSPMHTPDMKSISCVVVEADSTQRLWLYNLDGSVKKCFNEGIDSIGYYSWLSNDTMLYYKLTEPHSLRIDYENLNEDKWICSKPTRAFRKVKGNVFLYGIKDSLEVQYRTYNTVLKRSDLFAVHKGSGEDFVWNPELGLVKSEGAQLLRYDEPSKIWRTLFDFSLMGIKKITRFAFDSKNKQIAVVDNTDGK